MDADQLQARSSFGPSLGLDEVLVSYFAYVGKRGWGGGREREGYSRVLHSVLCPLVAYVSTCVCLPGQSCVSLHQKTKINPSSQQAGNLQGITGENNSPRLLFYFKICITCLSSKGSMQANGFLNPRCFIFRFFKNIYIYPPLHPRVHCSVLCTSLNRETFQKHNCLNWLPLEDRALESLENFVILSLFVNVQVYLKTKLTHTGEQNLNPASDARERVGTLKLSGLSLQTDQKGTNCTTV